MVPCNNNKKNVFTSSLTDEIYCDRKVKLGQVCLYIQHLFLLKLSERHHKIYTPKLHDTTAELQNSSIRRLTQPSQDREREVKLIRAAPEECGSSSGMIVRIYHSTQFCRSHDRLFHTHLSLNSCKSTLSSTVERVSKKGQETATFLLTLFIKKQ